MAMNYISARDVALKWNISTRRVQVLCEQGRIEGVFRIGTTWAIPEDAVKPADGRIKVKAVTLNG